MVSWSAVATCLINFRNFQKVEDSIEKVSFSTSQLISKAPLTLQVSDLRALGKPKRDYQQEAQWLYQQTICYFLDMVLHALNGLSQGILRMPKDCYYLLSTDEGNRKLNNFPKTHTNSWGGTGIHCFVQWGEWLLQKARNRNRRIFVPLFQWWDDFTKIIVGRKTLLLLLFCPPFLPPQALPGRCVCGGGGQCSKTEAACLPSSLFGRPS